MRMVPRSEWGARDPKPRTPLVLAALKGIAVHYTGMNADEQADHKNCPGRVRGIQAYHMDHHGWADIAYSWVVCKHGSVFEGRGWGIRTAAQGTNPGNDAYHAVCFLGDDSVNRDDVTDAGRGALAAVILEGQRLYPKAVDVRPHSVFRSTGCPGAELRGWIALRPWLAKPKTHKPPWQLLEAGKVTASGRLSNPLFVRKVAAALVRRGKVTLRDEP